MYFNAVYVFSCLLSSVVSCTSVHFGIYRIMIATEAGTFAVKCHSSHVLICHLKLSSLSWDPYIFDVHLVLTAQQSLLHAACWLFCSERGFCYSGDNVFTLVIRRTILHDLSVLAIRRTMQISSRPTEIIIEYFCKQSGDLRGWWVRLVRIKLRTMKVTVRIRG